MRHAFPIIRFFPGSDSMAISAQDLKIFQVLLPILQSSAPSKMATFRRSFQSMIDMMNIKTSNIRNTAFGTLGTQQFQNFNFALPIFTGFLESDITTSVPKILPAFIRAINCRTCLVAFSTFTRRRFPPMIKITLHRAIFAIPSFHAVLRYFKSLSAMNTISFFRCFLHTDNYITIHGKRQYPDYIAMSIKRIEMEARQERLFT